ncbi:MAG TPA: DUF5522 domain-containing protein [Thermoanaerobaculia bacterium]|nr:DUF5522 domain-containing protein [Thermoanaerobaculia bacterium]
MRPAAEHRLEAPFWTGGEYHFQPAKIGDRISATLAQIRGNFLLKRGDCCESGCRHCPYDFNKERRTS